MRSTRQQRNHDLMTRTILETARAIMREEGAAALSMQELARRLEMRAPSLYNYFAGKNEIYDALFRLGFALFADFMDQRVAGVESWQAYLRGYLEGYMAFALENPELYQLCFERPAPGFVPSPESLALSFGILQRSYERVSGWRAEMQTDLSDQQAVDLMLAMMHGLTALHMANEPNVPVGQGRFGSLISAAVSVFEKAWSQAAQSEGAQS